MVYLFRRRPAESLIRVACSLRLIRVACKRDEDGGWRRKKRGRGRERKGISPKAREGREREREGMGRPREDLIG